MNCLCSIATSKLIVCIRNVRTIMSRYDFLKSQVLRCWRKVESVCDVVISSGRVFQSPDTGSGNRERPVTDCLNVWQMAPSDDWCHQSVVSVSCPIQTSILGLKVLIPHLCVLGYEVLTVENNWHCSNTLKWNSRHYNWTTIILPSTTGRFRQQQLKPGTVYLPRLKPPMHCCSSGERQKRTSSTSRFWTNLRTIADSRTSPCSQHACLNYVQCPCNVLMW